VLGFRRADQDDAMAGLHGFVCGGIDPEPQGSAKRDDAAPGLARHGGFRERLAHQQGRHLGLADSKAPGDHQNVSRLRQLKIAVAPIHPSETTKSAPARCSVETFRSRTA
jgi:hypothetical protein